MKLKPNVILIVLDTLRDDYSSGLDFLLRSGFIHIPTAVASSSWTLPSHVSIFTGLMPSEHGVHEGSGVHIRNIHQLKSALARVNEIGIFKLLRDNGYLTYCLTANPLISPNYGFDFDFYRSYDARGDSTHTSQYLANNQSRLEMAITILRKRKLGLLLRLVYDDQIRRNTSRILHRPPLEKGSKYIIQGLKSMDLKEPFFLFINLMEAHPPYSWTERPSRFIQFDSILQRGCKSETHWSTSYKSHSQLAVQRCLDIVEQIRGFLHNSITIITSDHGQLLGESGRYDHGFFLDKVLVKIPLYVRLPNVAKLEFSPEAVVSLTEIPHLIDDVISNRTASLGSDLAVAESFSPIWDFSEMNRNGTDLSVSLNYRRLRIITRKGEGIYNFDTNLFEEKVGEIPKRLLDQCRADFLNRLVTAEINSSDSPHERAILDRLKQLGYE